MFCSNCGSEIADGSKFCSECGARINSDAEQSVHEHKVVSSSSNRGYVMDESKSSTKFDFDFGGNEPKSDETKKKSSVSFDWSSVIDESHKKPTRNIKSPWDSEYSEEAPINYTANTFSEASLDFDEGYRGPVAEGSVIEPEIESDGNAVPKEEPKSNTESLEEMIKRDSEESQVTPKGRTLNFIEVMKQEKEEREKTQQLRDPVIAPEPEAFDFDEPILPENEREHTQGYTDLKHDIVKELSETDNTDNKDEQNDRLDAASDDFENYINARRKSHDALFKAEPPQSFADTIKPSDEPYEEFKLPVDEFEAQMNELLGGSDGDSSDYSEAIDKNEENKLAATEPESEEDDLFNVDVDIKDTDEDEETLNEYLEATIPSRVARAKQREEDDEEFFEDEDESEEIEVFSYDDEFNVDTEELETDLNPEPKTSSSADILDDLSFEEEAEEPYEDDYLNILEPAREEQEEPKPVASKEISDEIDSAVEYDDEFNKVELKNETDLNPEPMEDLNEDALGEFAFGETDLDEPYTDEYMVEDTQQSSVSEENDNETQVPAPDEPVDATAVQDEHVVKAKDEVTKELENEIANLQKRLAELMGKDASEAEAVPARDIVTAEDLINEPVTGMDPEVETVTAEPEKSGKLTSVEEELAALGFDTIDDDPESGMLFAADEDASLGIVDGDAEAIPEQEEVMSIDELQKDLFGTDTDDTSVEATRKIDKFYTLYRKNEEFQQLLDEEYKKLQNGSADYTLMDDVLADYDDEASEEESEEDKIEAHHESVEAVVKAESAKLEEAKKNAGESLDGLNLSAINSAASESVGAESTTSAVTDVAKGVAPKVIDDDDEDSRGGVLTVIAVIVAILLVLLLVVILILNFAPDSAIAQKLSEMIGNFTNFAALNDGSETLL